MTEKQGILGPGGSGGSGDKKSSDMTKILAKEKENRARDEGSLQGERRDDNLDQRIQKYKELESTITQGQKQEYWIKMLEKEHHIITRYDGIIPISEEKKDERNRGWIKSSLPKLLEAIPTDCKSECTKLSDKYIHEMMERGKNQLLSSIHDSYHAKIGTLEQWKGQIKQWLGSLPTDYRNEKYGGKEFERGKSEKPLTEEEMTERVIYKLLVDATSDRYDYGVHSMRTMNLDVPTQQSSQELPGAHRLQESRKDFTQKWVKAQPYQEQGERGKNLEMRRNLIGKRINLINEYQRISRLREELDKKTNAFKVEFNNFAEDPDIQSILQMMRQESYFDLEVQQGIKDVDDHIKTTRGQFLNITKDRRKYEKEREFFMKESSNYNKEIEKYHENINEGEAHLPSFDTKGKYKLDPFEIYLS